MVRDNRKRQVATDAFANEPQPWIRESSVPASVINATFRSGKALDQLSVRAASLCFVVADKRGFFDLEMF